jgi:hypothetical protein
MDITSHNFGTLDFERLKASIEFVQRSVKVYGKVYPQPRLTKWYGPIGWHSDDEALFGGDPIVVSLSFGATRTFLVRDKATKKDITPFDLHDGSCLIMGKGVQQDFQHSIPKSKSPAGERINLTYRYALA